MGGKKKKKGAKKAKKEKNPDDDDEPLAENPLFTVNMPEFGWIRVELKLCDPPTPLYNTFKVVMRSDDRVLELKKRIIDFHGCVDNIHIFNKDPYPPRKKKDNYRMQPMPRVPPFRELPNLKMLMKEKEEMERKKKREAEREKDSEEEQKNKYDGLKEDPHKYDIIDKFDYPQDTYGENIVEYDNKEISLYEVFQNYGTAARPKDNPKDDPEEPPPKEKKEPPKPPTPPPKEEG